VIKTCEGLHTEDECAAASIEITRRANNQLMHALEVGDGDALDRAMSAHVRARRGWK
jgi:hypothetical protein